MKTWTKYVLAAFAVTGVGATGCSDSTEEPTGRATGSASTRGSQGLREYRHTLTQSLFALGGVPEAHSEFGISKAVGPWGVFGVSQSTGMVLALPNADAPSRLRARLPGDAATHNRVVRDYFLSNGLPVGEVLEVSVNSRVLATLNDDGTTSPSLQSYTSRIGRQYEGIEVVGSYAWAQFNEAGEVVTESVYWPAIPAQVLDGALAFKTKLENERSSASFFEQVPRDGHLAIHHTPGTWTDRFEASVSFDVVTFGRTTHYDLVGNTFELPEEKSSQ